MELATESVELLEQFAHGDVDAFETLFRQYQGQVYGWIVRIVRDTAIAEDLTIETFWRIHQARARFDPERSFGAWARRIATNAALDHLKSAPRQVPLDENLADGRPQQPGLDREQSERIERAFQKLPAKLCLVARLALLEEQPYREIGDALGISEGAVKSRVFRAVHLLRRRLKQLGIEP